MSISQNRLRERLADLRVQFEQAKQQVAAVAGAIADIEFWIAELEGETPPEPASPQPKKKKD